MKLTEELYANNGNSSVIAGSCPVNTLVLQFCLSAELQQSRRNGHERGQGRRGAADEDDGVPTAVDKFPGVGSFDAWRTSVPEYRAGMAKMRNRRWDEAIAHFRASITLYEYHPDAWLAVGRCIEKKGGLQSDAEAAYRNCLKLDNQSWNGWKCLANVLYTEKRYDESRQALTNALNLNPPPKQRQKMGKMVQMIDSGLRNANTQGMNNSQ